MQSSAKLSSRTLSFHLITFGISLGLFFSLASTTLLSLSFGQTSSAAFSFNLNEKQKRLIELRKELEALHKENEAVKRIFNQKKAELDSLLARSYTRMDKGPGEWMKKRDELFAVFNRAYKTWQAFSDSLDTKKREFLTLAQELNRELRDYETALKYVESLEAKAAQADSKGPPLKELLRIHADLGLPAEQLPSGLGVYITPSAAPAAKTLKTLQLMLKHMRKYGYDLHFLLLDYESYFATYKLNKTQVDLVKDQIEADLHNTVIGIYVRSQIKKVFAPENICKFIKECRNSQNPPSNEQEIQKEADAIEDLLSKILDAGLPVPEAKASEPQQKPADKTPPASPKAGK